TRLPYTTLFRSRENFEADEELIDPNNDSEISVKAATPIISKEKSTESFSEPEGNSDIQPIVTPNLTSFDDKSEEKTTVTLTPETTPESSSKTAEDDFDFKVEIAQEVDELDDTERKSAELVKAYGRYDHTLELGGFQRPTVDILKDYGNEEINIHEEELEENKNKIVGFLKNFNVGIVDIIATIGPTVTLYEIVPEAGIRVAAIKKLQDDIALNLSA